MSRIRWTSLALQDLQSISTYIESRRDLPTANRVCRSVYDTAQHLRSFPELGKPGLEQGTRELVVPAFPAYILVYRIAAQDAVEIPARLARRAAKTRSVVPAPPPNPNIR